MPVATLTRNALQEIPTLVQRHTGATVTTTAPRDGVRIRTHQTLAAYHKSVLAIPARAQRTGHALSNALKQFLGPTRAASNALVVTVDSTATPTTKKTYVAIKLERTRIRIGSDQTTTAQATARAVKRTARPALTPLLDAVVITQRTYTTTWTVVTSAVTSVSTRRVKMGISQSRHRRRNDQATVVEWWPARKQRATMYIANV